MEVLFSGRLLSQKEKRIKEEGLCTQSFPLAQCNASPVTPMTNNKNRLSEGELLPDAANWSEVVKVAEDGVFAAAGSDTGECSSPSSTRLPSLGAPLGLLRAPAKGNSPTRR